MSKPDDVLVAPPRHAGQRPSRRAARYAALALTAVLTFVTTGAVAAYVDFTNDIEVSHVDGLVAGPAPSKPPADPDDPYAGQELNILVMGTDFRDEENVKIAGAADSTGMRSDTTFVVHVSGDRSRVEVVSIPRDSWVQLPACKLPDGSMSQPYVGQFNWAFDTGAQGGTDMDYAAACTITAVQSLTGLTITNHVILKMTGVIGVVDAMDGVPLCLPEPVHEDPRYGTLDLPAGPNRLDGRTSIKFLRARHGTGMGLELGSDLTRITRQQTFLNAMQREIKSKNVLTDSSQLYAMVSAVLKSVVADPQLADPKSVVGLVFSMRNLRPSDVIFTELPVVDSVHKSGRVDWTAESDAVWQRLVNDEPPADYVPAPDPSAAATASAGTSGADGTGSDGNGSGDTGTDGNGSGDTGTDGNGSDGAGSGDTAADGTGADAAPTPTPTPTPETLPEGICG
ncbi:LCP family protein [Sediminihabitans luteus]|nr:LCP family protein [Sediminihabitans luteus]